MFICFAAWFIGSTSGQRDILPPVEISLQGLDSMTATLERGVLYRGTQVLTNVSEVIALAEGKEEDPADNLFFLEPGRLLYHSIEFCNFVHVCTVAMGTPSIVIRTLILQHYTQVLFQFFLYYSNYLQGQKMWNLLPSLLVLPPGWLRVKVLEWE